MKEEAGYYMIGGKIFHIDAIWEVRITVRGESLALTILVSRDTPGNPITVAWHVMEAWGLLKRPTY